MAVPTLEMNPEETPAGDRVLQTTVGREVSAPRLCSSTVLIRLPSSLLTKNTGVLLYLQRELPIDIDGIEVENGVLTSHPPSLQRRVLNSFPEDSQY